MYSQMQYFANPDANPAPSAQLVYRHHEQHWQTSLTSLRRLQISTTRRLGSAFLECLRDRLLSKYPPLRPKHSDTKNIIVYSDVVYSDDESSSDYNCDQAVTYTICYIHCSVLLYVYTFSTSAQMIRNSSISFVDSDICHRWSGFLQIHYMWLPHVPCQEHDWSCAYCYGLDISATLATIWWWSALQSVTVPGWS